MTLAGGSLDVFSGVVVIVAGQAFSNSTKFRVRTTNMLKAGDVAERTAAMFLDDVSQTGVKSYKESGDASNPDRMEKSDAVYIAPTGSLADSSSFVLVKNASGSSLTLKGTWTNSSWYPPIVVRCNASGSMTVTYKGKPISGNNYLEYDLDYKPPYTTTEQTFITGVVVTSDASDLRCVFGNK